MAFSLGPSKGDSDKKEVSRTELAWLYCLGLGLKETVKVSPARAVPRAPFRGPGLTCQPSQWVRCSCLGRGVASARDSITVAVPTVQALAVAA